MLRRRTTVLATALAVLAAPVLGACSGSAEDDVRAAAKTFLDDWAKGSRGAAAQQATDAAAEKKLLDQTAADLPGAKLSAAIVAAKVDGSSARVSWTATWDLAAAPDWTYRASLLHCARIGHAHTALALLDVLVFADGVDQGVPLGFQLVQRVAEFVPQFPRDLPAHAADKA